MEFHHIGVATDDAQGTSDRLTAVIDATECHVEEFAGLEVRFIKFEEGYFELLEPIDHDGISRFIERNGPGMHHVAFETDDIVSQLAQAKAAGVEPIDDAPRPGAWGHKIAFLHPADTGGILIEYLSNE